MKTEQIKSEAFRKATLTSESYRIIGLLTLLVALVVYTFARGLALEQWRLLAAQALLLLLAIAYEGYVLSAVKLALRENRDVPPATWLLNVLVETQIPTLALVVLIRNQTLNPYLLLVAPAILVYFFFIILSTLRLSPVFSILTGILSAMGYLTVAFYTFVSYPVEQGNFPSFSLKIYFVYAGLIVGGGAVAAFVAWQIRVHVESALHEAELQSQLEQLNHNLDVARSIQQGLLPTKPLGLEGFDIAGWNQPADQTGGDYFDWLELANGKIAISLGDATGHGIGPALVSTSCRAYARASFLAGDGEHNGLLDHLNQLLAADLESNRFVTFAVIFLDPESSNVEVLSAGHGPILWYKRAADTIENIEAQGIPLGMIAGVRYEHGIDGSLDGGDILAMITDGFFEWENPDGEEFGIKRLESVLHESRDLSAEEIVLQLRAAVAEFCRGTKQMDDLTAVILKRNIKPTERKSLFKKRLGSKGNSLEPSRVKV
jgi:serine phosphatase RsbU (regulator of sigma subunit)